MGQIAEDKLQLVRGLIEQAPDNAIRSLQMALSADRGHDAGLTRVQQMVEAEAADRRARNLVFSPVAPLCVPPGPFKALSFPPRTLSLIWRATRQEAPDEVAAALAEIADWREETSSPDVFNQLCSRAAEALRARGPGLFAAAADAADTGSGAEILAKCLDLAAITRQALLRLPDWLGRMTEEKAATLRLAYRDAVTTSEDSGPYFFEMLAAQLAEPWLILRVISGVMDHPHESYFSASELAGFGERMLAEIERRGAEVAAFKPDAGPRGARAAAEAVHFATIEIAEFEQTIEVTPEAEWGKRLIGCKKMLAAAIEAHLRATDDAVAQALPLATIRLGPRTVRGVPRLTTPPDPALVERAKTLLTFMHEVRSSAATGGFSSARSKAQEVVDARLDQYVEDILDELRSETPTEPERARAYLDIAAELCGLARDEKAAQIVRRRAAAA